MDAPENARSLLVEQEPPSSGGFGSVVLFLVRVIVGALAMAIGVRAIMSHGQTVIDATAWGIPQTSNVAWACSVLLLFFGFLLFLGVSSRLSALLLLLIALALIATAGRTSGGLLLEIPAGLAVGCLLVVVRGGGAGQLLDVLDPPW